MMYNCHVSSAMLSLAYKATQTDVGGPPRGHSPLQGVCMHNHTFWWKLHTFCTVHDCGYCSSCSTGQGYVLQVLGFGGVG
jgi:hypothetical protein